MYMYNVVDCSYIGILKKAVWLYGHTHSFAVGTASGCPYCQGGNHLRQERAHMGPELGQQLAIPVAKPATACGSGWRFSGDLWWNSKRLPRLPIGQPPALQAKVPMGLVLRL